MWFAGLMRSLTHLMNVSLANKRSVRPDYPIISLENIGMNDANYKKNSETGKDEMTRKL
jgi:hypothetical protein